MTQVFPEGKAMNRTKAIVSILVFFLLRKKEKSRYRSYLLILVLYLYKYI